MLRLTLSAVLLLLLTPGCGAGPPVVVGTSGTDEDALLLGTSLASAIAQTAYASRQMVVEGTYQATMQGGGMQTGQVIRTGTLTQTVSGSFQYSRLPGDKLVVKLQDITHEFEVHSAEGNNQAMTATAWLDSNHRMEYLHRIPEVCEVVIKANRIGMGWASHITGWYVHDGLRYELDLKAEGGSYFEQGGRSGQESKTDYKIEGSLTSPDRKLTVDERHFFHLISLNDAVTHSIDEYRNTLQVGDTSYRWIDVSVTKIFRTTGGRMMPVFDAAEKWKAQGKVTKNGKLFGTFRLGVGGKSVDVNRKYHGTIDIEIAIPNGVVTVQTFRGS